MITLFLKLLLAHLLGDFVLQPRSWVRKRKEHIGYLLLHMLVHAVLLVILFLPELSDNLQLIIFIVCSHLLIDSLKIGWEKQWPYKPFHIFIIDQFLHLLAIMAVILYQFGLPEEWIPLVFSDKTMLYIIAFLLTTCVSPIVLRVFFSKWNKESDVATKPGTSLVDAGLLIGIMERLLIVLFIQLGFLSGIGFLLGAKSIFRFGDLTNAKDTKFTEYILLGTLASFVLGIGIGYGLKLGLKYWI